MSENHHKIKRLPGNPLPEGAPKPEICDTQTIEVFALGDERAMLVVEKREHETVVTQPWLSVKDNVLAQQLVEAIRSLHFKPGSPVVIRVDGNQTALTNVLQGAAVTASQVMTKPVDKGALPPPADGVRPRDMDEQEVAAHLAETEDSFARAVMDNSADPTDWEDARARSRRAFEAVVPEGGRTPGHSFLVVEDDRTGEKVALLWVALKDGGGEETKQSYCYSFEVEAGKRGMGFGRKTMAIWEHYAAGQGATSIGLNVFGKNLAAQRLYSGAGLTVATTLFRIEE